MSERAFFYAALYGVLGLRINLINSSFHSSKTYIVRLLPLIAE